jgi:hypothetical protein
MNNGSLLYLLPKRPYREPSQTHVRIEAMESLIKKRPVEEFHLPCMRVPKIDQEWLLFFSWGLKTVQVSRVSAFFCRNTLLPDAKAEF